MWDWDTHQRCFFLGLRRYLHGPGSLLAALATLLDGKEGTMARASVCRSRSTLRVWLSEQHLELTKSCLRGYSNLVRTLSVLYFHKLVSSGRIIRLEWFLSLSFNFYFLSPTFCTEHRMIKSKILQQISKVLPSLPMCFNGAINQHWPSPEKCLTPETTPQYIWLSPSQRIYKILATLVFYRPCCSLKSEFVQLMKIACDTLRLVSFLIIAYLQLKD